MRGKRVKSIPSRRPYSRMADRGKVSYTMSSSSSESVQDVPTTMAASASSDLQDQIPLTELLRKKTQSRSSVPEGVSKSPKLNVSKEKGKAPMSDSSTDASSSTSVPMSNRQSFGSSSSHKLSDAPTQVPPSPAPAQPYSSSQPAAAQPAPPSSATKEADKTSSPPPQTKVPEPRGVTIKTGRRCLPRNIPSVPIDGISFHHEENAQCWRFVVQTRLADEVNISYKHQSCVAIMELINQAGLSRTILNVGPFYPKLIREVIANLSSDFDDPSSPDYQTIHVRGRTLVISPYVINTFLGLTPSENADLPTHSTDTLASVLTGGSLIVWPLTGIPSAALSVKYAILHKIGIVNWFPSSHASSVSVALASFLF